MSASRFAPSNRAEAFLYEWVRPRADTIDRDVAALREALGEMGRLGFLGLRIPAEYGGLAFETLAFHRFQEASARSSGALAFLESQHQGACSLLAKSENAAVKDSFLPRMARGEVRSAIAFSHLRRTGAPLLTATAEAGGYRLDGHLPWVTGWGLFEVCLTAGRLSDGRTLFVTHALKESPSLKASPVLELAAMGVTQTVAVDLHGLAVPNSQVVGVYPSSWIEDNDLIAVALQSPLALGCARAGIDLLYEEAEKRATSAISEAAGRLERELEACRGEAYRVMEEPRELGRSLEARAWAIDLAGRAAHAAVVASGGAGNILPHPAQRIYREALAFSVLALTGPIQRAALARLSSG